MLHQVMQPVEPSSSVGDLSWGYGAGYANGVHAPGERGGSQRYPVVVPLLAVCEYYSGQIFDLGASGFSFRIAHFRDAGKTLLRGSHLHPSRHVAILAPGSCQHLLKSLKVEAMFDRFLGPLYDDSSRIMLYRRQVRLATALKDREMDLLWPYLGDPLPMAEASGWRG